ncbi:hypothetical protein BJV78DRAFT_1215443, partial [Lactifluus subvellereus]
MAACDHTFCTSLTHYCIAGPGGPRRDAKVTRIPSGSPLWVAGSVCPPSLAGSEPL